jgi:serine/threonine-protein kinase
MSVQVSGIAAVGDVLAGKYRVDKILGIGGMGMVVAATHLELDQRVAIKFMLPGSHESAETSARFLREAKAAGRLNSDHVCRVMDVGRFDNGAPYIVMEYLQGEDLGAVLRRRSPLRVSEAVDYILQGIEGIAEAHANGIIHRDLKPENLFLHKRNDGSPIVKVLDFGISKFAKGGGSTSTGDIMGSPAYMAPEQMESSTNVDQRADLWSLGVVLYRMVAGKAPFHGETLPLLCMHVVNDDPDPMSAVRGDLPDGFEAVVMKCLQKEPVDRYRDVGELAQALAPFGPKNATTSASRIRIVLTRQRGSAATISHEFARVTPPHGVPVAEAPVPKREPEATTFSATAGQSIASSRSERHSWGVTGAILGGLGLVALALVVMWRSGWIGDVASQEAPHVPVVAKPSSGPDVSPPRPIVEPIVDNPPSPPVPRAADPAPATAPVASPDPSPAASPDPAPVASPDPVPATTPLANPAPAPNPDRKKHKPHRAPGRPTPRAGSAAGAGGGSSAGSAAPPDDDDKWTHMTHDEKQP